MSHEARGRCDICYVSDGTKHHDWCEFGEGCSSCDAKDAEIARLRRSLEAAHFTDEGGELWKPPVQNIGVFQRLQVIESRAGDVEGVAEVIYMEGHTGSSVEEIARALSARLLGKEG